MIALLLYLFRLLPGLFGGHRRLALENLALRQRLGGLPANDDSAHASSRGPALLGRAGQALDRVEAVPRHRDPRHRPTVVAAPVPRVLDSALWALDRRARASTPRSGPSSPAWPPQIPWPRHLMASMESRSASGSCWLRCARHPRQGM